MPAAEEKVLLAANLFILIAVTVARVEDVFVAAIGADVRHGDNMKRRGVTAVPQTFTRPGLMVVEPVKAPTSAGSRNLRPTEAWPMHSFKTGNAPASALIRPDVTKAPMTNLRVGMPLSSAAR